MSGAGENGSGSCEARTSGVARWALIGSLGLNLFLIAAVASHLVIGGPGDRRDRHQSRERTSGLIERVLGEDSPEFRALANELRETRRAAYRGSRDQSKAAFDAMLAALRAESFDRQSYLDASAARDAARSEARLGATAAMADFAAKLDMNQRRRLADMLEERQRRRAERWRRRAQERENN